MAVGSEAADGLEATEPKRIPGSAADLSKRSSSTADLVSAVIGVLSEDIRSMEEMEAKNRHHQEEIARLQAKHEEELERLREEHEEDKLRLRTEWEHEKSDFMEKVADVKTDMVTEMTQFQTSCEQAKNSEIAKMEEKLEASKKECRHLADESAKLLVRMEEMRKEFDQKMGEEKASMTQQIADSRAECRLLEEEKARLTQETEEFRATCEQNMTREKDEMNQRLAQLRQECQIMSEEKLTMKRSMEVFQAECKRKMAKEKLDMERKMADESKKMAEEKAAMRASMETFRAETQKAMEDEKAEVERRTAEYRMECERKMVEEKAEMGREMEKTHELCRKVSVEKESISKEMAMIQQESEAKLTKARAELTQEMERIRKENDQKMTEAKSELKKKSEEIREDCQRRLEEEKAEGERRLSETRLRTQAQLQMEREITDHIRVALSELPPLQSAMELGDLAKLEEELRKWKSDRIDERFGECKGVVEAVVNMARERLFIWRGVDHTFKEVLKQAERLPAEGCTHARGEQCHRLFRALKEAQLTKMSLQRTDPQCMSRFGQVLLMWQERACIHSNSVQRAIIRKVCICPNLGTFDFTDLDICLRLVDRSGPGSQVFLSRAQAIVDDETIQPQNLRSCLSHVETMLFFLKYTKSEDLQLTYLEFRKKAAKMDPKVLSYLDWAAAQYPPGAELARLSSDLQITDKAAVSKILEEIRRPPRTGRDGLGPFRDIFYHWALAMRNRFDLLVLPHHTQVVTLLIFQRFLQSREPLEPHALIAQVGTGEGKSMIVAALAVYVVVVLGKKAHVVVDDETLLERDFWTFKSLYDAFRVPTPNGGNRPLSLALCMSEEKLSTSGERPPCCVARVDPEADICYCEAKHVQSYYAQVARGDQHDFSGYANRVLILDEVDALVIDEEPNEAFVYPNQELSDMATKVAMSLKMHGGNSELVPESALDTFRNSGHPSAARVVREMQKEWTKGASMIAGEDYVYSKEAGKYCALQAGRANPKKWSLALECRNFQDGLSKDILFQERLFVMSRPRVFRKYHKILGLSGSIGSDAERTFLRSTYRAMFFEVPPFLKTCRGSPFHEPKPVRLGADRHAVYVEPTHEAQIQRVASVALEAREKVPVLVIAKDRGMADQMVDILRQAARSRGLGGSSEDVVRSLSRTLYEADPEQWKENLNRATLPLGDKESGFKSWRITVTDPRGGRGTDYRVDDPDVDAMGGLLLLPTVVPPIQRTWTQFLGRTARQDRQGQYHVVLCAADYSDLAEKFNEALPSSSPDLTPVEAILDWGDRDMAKRIRSSAALYNCGVRVNEVCETIFGQFPALLRSADARTVLVDVCQRFRWMSVREIDEAFSRISGFNPADLHTEANDLGRPDEPPRATPRTNDPLMMMPRSLDDMNAAVPKVVVFALDWSTSMLSRDTGTPFTRFETCVQCFRRILRDQVRDSDMVGIVGFGPTVQTVCPPVIKSRGMHRLEAHISSLQPQRQGGTCFFDAVAQCLALLGQRTSAPPGSPRWLVCLTDGDDLGSRRENMNGEVVTGMLERNIVPGLNMIMITVGRLKEKNVRVIDTWVSRVKSSGGVARHVSENNAAAIAKAFEVVAEILAAEVGGATEC